MKIYIIWLIALFSVISYSQGGTLIISKKNSARFVTIEENKRIKIETIDGRAYWGRFRVLDSTSIMMKGKVIPLKSIVKIRRKTLAGGIAKPVFMTVGAVIIPVGMYAATVFTVLGTGGGGAVLGWTFFGGTSMISIPTMANSHPTERNWVYSVKKKEDDSTLLREVGLGKSRAETLNTVITE